MLLDPSLLSSLCLFILLLAMEQEEDAGPEVQNPRIPVRKSGLTVPPCGHSWMRRKCPFSTCPRATSWRPLAVGGALGPLRPLLPLGPPSSYHRLLTLVSPAAPWEAPLLPLKNISATSQRPLFLNQKIRRIKTTVKSQKV